MDGQDNKKFFGVVTRLPRPPFLFALCLVFGMGAGVIFDRWMLAGLCAVRCCF